MSRTNYPRIARSNQLCNGESDRPQARNPSNNAGRQIGGNTKLGGQLHLKCLLNGPELMLLRARTHEERVLFSTKPSATTVEGDSPTYLLIFSQVFESGNGSSFC